MLQFDIYGKLQYIISYQSYSQFHSVKLLSWDQSGHNKQRYTNC